MKKKPFVVFMLSSFMLLFVFAPQASAAAHTISSGNAGTPFDLSTLNDGDTLNITTTDAVELTGDGGDVSIDCVSGANITLIDVTITAVNYPISFTGSGNQLMITGTNTLTSGSGYAAVSVNSTAVLTISGTGTLNATGSEDAAGIGGDKYRNSGSIIIEGASITAKGGRGAAGIGGGYDGTGNVTIQGSANITATGGNYGAGIGGGDYKGGSVTIAGDAVVNATGGIFAAGIGGGEFASGSVYIMGNAQVSAVAQTYGAGIGGGYNNDGDVRISGSAVVNATGGSDAAGIGGGYDGNATVNISQTPTITAEGNRHGPGIGGAFGASATITIQNDPIIRATGGSLAPGIGSGEHSTAVINISGGEIYAHGGSTADDIGVGIGGSASGYLSEPSDVFLYNNQLNGSLTHFTHTYVNSETITSFAAYGHTAFPSDWEGRTAYGFLSAREVLLNAATGGTPYDLSTLKYLDYVRVETTDLVELTGTAPYTHHRIELYTNSNIELIDVIMTAQHGCIQLLGGTNNIITITGTNTLKSGNGIPVIEVDGFIELTLEGTGTLNAQIDTSHSTPGGAAIGSYASPTDENGKITINGGTIYAQGYPGAAAIGGASGDDGLVIINGGTIYAIGGDSGAGIGGGYQRDGNVTIQGNAIVTATGGFDAAGIGGGNIGSSTVTVQGNANVTATGGFNAAGIGSGRGSDSGSITIQENAVVTATGGLFGAGIGGGEYGNGTVTIQGNANVTATGASAGAGIGGGSQGDGTITVQGNANVTANGGASGAGIGGGYNGTGVVTVTGGEVAATGGDGGAGIGGGYDETGTVTITDGQVIAIGGDYAAAIGGGSYAAGTVTITGGEIYAQGGAYGVDIGAGASATGSGTISGGAVFLYKDSISPSIAVTNLTHYSHETIVSNTAYSRSSFPDSWNNRTGYAYLLPVTITYNYNDSATLNDVVNTYQGALLVEPNPEPSRAGYAFNGWHYNMDGTSPIYYGTTYAQVDDTFYGDWVEMGTYSGGLDGKLTLDSGAGASGAYATLESKPIISSVGSSGAFDFGNVYYTNHTLIVTDTSGTEVKRYAITFTPGSASSAVVDEGAATIDITYTANAKNVFIPVSLDAAQTDAAVGTIVFSYPQVANPQTSDSSYNYMWLIIAVFAVLGAMAVTVLYGKKQQ